MKNDADSKKLVQKINHLENEIKILQQEKMETADKFYSLYNKMEEEVRRRSSLIQEQNFKLLKEVDRRKLAEHNLRKTLIEKDYLFKELHHRVKNNLQLISSIMNLQIKDTSNEELKAMLGESQQKLKSMALIHDFIYDSDSSDKINLSEYLTFLSREVFRSSVKHFSLRELKIDIKPNIIGSLKTSLPCGLVINELITNSLKHAFDETEKGEIKVKLAQKNNNFILNVSDTGKGLDEKTMYNNNHCLGLNLVKLLVESQLKGKINFSNNSGADFEIIIPNSLDKE